MEKIGRTRGHFNGIGACCIMMSRLEYLHRRVITRCNLVIKKYTGGSEVED